MEWMQSIYNSGYWMPDMIALAGGTDMLANPGGYSSVTNWGKSYGIILKLWSLRHVDLILPAVYRNRLRSVSFLVGINYQQL